MTTILVIIFILVYAAIALEEPLGVNKSASALIGAGLLWTIYAIGAGHGTPIDGQLDESLVNTAQIALFLMGAMTVVEVIDSHDGFEVITRRIEARSVGALAWIIALVTFFLSAVLDNLTTAIVMVSLLRKLVSDKEHRLMLAGTVVIAANAGGAWSPIGDVTTTMLWIAERVTSVAIIKGVFLPSLVNLLIPLAVISYMLRGKPVVVPHADSGRVKGFVTTSAERNTMFALGLAALLAVPAFKTITHLPPFMGILFGLGIIWAVGDLIHRDKEDHEREEMVIAKALTRIDMSAIVFFIGILLAVATLEHTGVLAGLAEWLAREIGRLDLIVIAFGFVSAVVDNVPIVAAAIGMYDPAQYPTDSFLWEFMAYCAGTGGSILIIGSAAGVAAMGIEKINFLWYLRRLAPLALLGYLGGAAVYIVQYNLLH